MPECYYRLLGVEPAASLSEIKTAYRKKALLLHPDKSKSGNPEEFTLLHKAYQVLSDGEERRWYDHSRGEPSSGTEHFCDLSPYFDISCYREIDDSEDGFFTIYSRCFQAIAKREKSSAELPEFGSSSTEKTLVRSFYSAWGAFMATTAVDSEALALLGSNRAQKREIERAILSKKQEQRSRYQETVRRLVAFVKRRDSRLAVPTRKDVKKPAKKPPTQRDCIPSNGPSFYCQTCEKQVAGKTEQQHSSTDEHQRSFLRLRSQLLQDEAILKSLDIE